MSRRALARERDALATLPIKKNPNQTGITHPDLRDQNVAT
jgi:hypothetical protein